MDPEAYTEAKSLFIKAFKEQHPDEDINDPRQDHNLEIGAYDVLDSEDESDAEAK